MFSRHRLGELFRLEVSFDPSMPIIMNVFVFCCFKKNPSFFLQRLFPATGTALVVTPTFPPKVSILNLNF